jgi:tRNA 2-thiouridine synthesizing protein E
MTRELEQDFAEAGGRRFLYTLFPGGPLAQGCKLAGLPLPQGTLNRSFGSVH